MRGTGGPARNPPRRTHHSGEATMNDDNQGGFSSTISTCARWALKGGAGASQQGGGAGGREGPQPRCRPSARRGGRFRSVTAEGLRCSLGPCVDAGPPLLAAPISLSPPLQCRLSSFSHGTGICAGGARPSRGTVRASWGAATARRRSRAALPSSACWGRLPRGHRTAGQPSDSNSSLRPGCAARKQSLGVSDQSPRPSQIIL